MPACRYCQKERSETDFYLTGKFRKDWNNSPSLAYMKNP